MCSPTRQCVYTALAQNGKIKLPDNDGMRKRNRLSALVLAIFLGVFLSGILAHAQAAKNASFQLMKISVAGAGGLNESQIVSISKLFPGEDVTLDDLRAAANRLAQYGVFDKVSYRYVTQGKELDVQFHVEPSSGLLPCRLDNFVWFTNASLNATLAREVPLYSGSVPQSGAMLDDVEKALQNLLEQKGVHASVQFIPFSASLGQKATAIDFSESGVSLPIREIHFPGAHAISEADLINNSQPLLGQDYAISQVELFARTTLLPLYGERGYLRAQFGEPVARVLGTNSGEATQDISVSVPVEEGNDYDWDGATWTGNQLFSSAALNQILGMQAKAPADMMKYGQRMKKVRDAYSKQGYVQLKITAQQKLDDSARKVSYLISIDEGPQFHMGTITVDGLTARDTRRVLQMWKLKPGDIFDGTYVSDFLKKAAAVLYSSGTKVGEVKTSIRVDPASKIANVEIDFR
jgi:outer membrane protein assembly factor BamA